jgi:hypothetical protein
MTETGTVTVNSAQRLSENPWHNMKGMRGRMRIQGTILPKRLLRPYFYTYPERIDDKQYLAGSISSLKDSLHYIYGFIYLIAIGNTVIWALTRFEDTIHAYTTLICLSIAIPLHLIGKRLKSNRFDVYDREKGTIRREYGWFKLKYHETPFWECEGYLVSAPNHMGLMRHMLFLEHPTLGAFLLTEGADLDLPLGFWSFLIQYMDKSKPPPDIPFLKDYPNREPGLGEWSIWKKKMSTFQIDDPYALWLKELEQHPELDVGNYGRDTARHNQLRIVIIGSSFLMLMALIVATLAIFIVMLE